jgi:hypothetical protein
MFWSRFRSRGDTEALDAAVRVSGKLATALVVAEAVAESHVFPAASTHFGGSPYFERGDTWPTLHGRPYDFVCQVNLRDCPHRPDVPFDLFTVFYCWSDEAWSSDDWQRLCHVRTYRAPSAEKAVSVPRPPPLDAEDYRVRPCPVRTEPLMTYPWSAERFPTIAAEAARFKNPGDAYDEALERLGFGQRDRTRVGGHATWVHEATLEGDGLVFLAQIEHEPAARNCILDAAPVYIAVSATDPARIEVDASQTH